MKKLATVLLALLFSASARQSNKHSHILGVAHIALYENDLNKARTFYKDFLGYAEPYSLKNEDGNADRIAFIKINDYQYVELSAGPPKRDGQLNHISLYTDDAEALRQYLASEGVQVPENAPAPAGEPPPPKS